MRVIVEVASGPAAGKKTALAAHQLIEVGRTDWADFAIRDDPRMSGRHFRLETDAAGCYVEDLGSSNGTSVNGVRITQRTALRDGDQVIAGESTFVVRMPGDATREGLPRVAASDELPWSPASVGGEPARSDSLQGAPASVGPVSYAVETCGSGLTLCRGTVEQIPPAELAVRLCQFLPVHLIVDFRKLGVPLPAELKSPHYLFDWLAPGAAAAVSPVLLSQDELLTWPTLIEQGWGKDAVVCLFSNQEKGAILEHLRRSCRAHPGADDKEGAILGCCWPSILGSLLAHFTPTMVRDLLTGIDAVLVESSNPPATWRIYGAGQVTKMLDQLGFRHQES